jgi:hypothetical protein
MRVSTSDGPQGEFAISPKVQVEFERQYKTGIGKAFESDLKMEHIYWLAWKAMHYAGRVVKPFDTWLDDVAEIEVVNESTGPLDETA